MNIREIEITTYPIILVSDIHCEINKIINIKSLYPHNKIVCLGDITDLFYKDDKNKNIIQYFIDNNIPTCEGNHDSHISGVVNGNTIMFLDIHNSIDIDCYNLPKHQCKYLSKLPRGIKLNVSNGKYYLLYHHLPKDIWGFKEKGTLSRKDFISNYNITHDCLGVCHGHLHIPFIEEYSNLTTKRISVGPLKYDHYAIIDEDGIKLKQL